MFSQAMPGKGYKQIENHCSEKRSTFKVLPGIKFKKIHQQKCVLIVNSKLHVYKPDLPSAI